MTREQIKNFNFRAMIMLARETPDFEKPIRKEGYDIHNGIMTSMLETSGGFNGKFQQVLLKVYREEVENNEIVKKMFDQFCEKYPIVKKQRHFIIVGDNNFWCTNISIDEDKDINEELEKEFDELKQTLDSENIPDKFIVYETVENTPM